MNLKELLRLIERYRSGKATHKETRAVDAWYEGMDSTQEGPDPDMKLKEERIWNAIIEDPALAPLGKAIPQDKPSRRMSPVWWAAACLMIAGALSWVYLEMRQDVEVSHDLTTLSDLSPGGNAATLTLGDGSVIDLNALAQGEQVSFRHTGLEKTADGEIAYLADSGRPAGAQQIHTISTPRGGQYKVVLPDSTVVWLNAASSLKYPARFDADARTVYLSGEAYFEVHKTKHRGKRVPFYVQTRDQRIEVLGTHFNVKAYAEEHRTTTTLLEGKVQVSGYAEGQKTTQARVLQVGEQSTLEKGTLRVAKANVEKTIAWKNGKFLFAGENIRTIMDDISRWYNIDVEYRGDLRKVNFEGSLSRYDNVVEFLRKLELTGTVKFKILTSGEGQEKERRILVMP